VGVPNTMQNPPPNSFPLADAAADKDTKPLVLVASLRARLTANITSLVWVIILFLVIIPWKLGTATAMLKPISASITISSTRVKPPFLFFIPFFSSYSFFFIQFFYSYSPITSVMTSIITSVANWVGCNHCIDGCNGAGNATDICLLSTDGWPELSNNADRSES
jgi:hypothetical protein